MKTWMTLLLITAIVSAGAHAETMTIVTGEWAPYTSEQLEHYGAITEIVSLALQEMGQEFEYKFYPWRRGFELVKKGKVWATFPYFYTEERAKHVFYSDPLFSGQTKFFYYKKTKDYTFDTLEDLKDYNVGLIIGYFYEEDFKKAGLQINYSVDELSSFKKLVSGKTELSPIDELVGWQLIHTHFPEEAQNFGVLEKAFYVGDSHLVASKKYSGSKELLEQFNAALQTLKDNGTYAAILNKYGISQ